MDRTIVYYYQILLPGNFFERRVTKEKNSKLERGTEYVEMRKIKSNNLKNIDIRFPKNKLTCITGISGSGKSTLVENIIFPALSRSIGKLEPIKGLSLNSQDMKVF